MDYKVNKPNKPLNSRIFADENKGCQLFETNDGLFVSGVKSQEEADALILAHNPPAPIEPTIEDKLASVGLSLAELKAALS